MQPSLILEMRRFLMIPLHSCDICFFLLENLNGIASVVLVIRNMNRILGIDHSRIVDLLQVLDTSPTIDVLVNEDQWRSLKVAASRDPDCAIDHHF